MKHRGKQLIGLLTPAALLFGLGVGVMPQNLTAQAATVSETLDNGVSYGSRKETPDQIYIWGCSKGVTEFTVPAEIDACPLRRLTTRPLNGITT